MDDGIRTRIIVFPLLAFVLILADQVTKHLAEGANITIYNSGISFGLFKGVEHVNSVMIVVATLALFLFIYLLAFRAYEFHSHTGLLLLVAGAAGNLIDRITQGAVIDFIRIGSFPVFNLADAYLSVGVVLIVIATIRSEREERALQKEP